MLARASFGAALAQTRCMAVAQAMLPRALGLLGRLLLVQHELAAAGATRWRRACSRRRGSSGRCCGSSGLRKIRNIVDGAAERALAPSRDRSTAVHYQAGTDGQQGPVPS